MKKILSILLAVLFMAASCYAIMPASPGIGEIKGQGKFPSDPHRTFRLVRYMQQVADGAAPVLSKDAIVIWDTSASGDDGVTITTTTTSSDSRVAGIVVLATVGTEDAGTTPTSAFDQIGGKNWTWLQTYGLSQVDMAPGASAAVGEALATGTLGGYATRHTLSQDPGTALDDTTNGTQFGNAGFFYDAATVGAANVEVFVRTE